MKCRYNYFEMNNKVYVNPKFSRISTEKTLTENQNIVMHINPLFTQQSEQTITRTDPNYNSKIFINPTFISTKTHEYNQGSNQHGENSNYSKEKSVVLHTIENPFLMQSISSQNMHDSNFTTKTTSSMSKSRYCLVRNNEKSNQPASKEKQATNTVKINKYKSIQINLAKRNLENKRYVKSPETYHTDVKASGQKHKYLKIHKNRSNHVFKATANQSETRSTSNVPFSSSKMYIRNTLHNQNIPSKTEKIFRKNNMPCPLFKKYGKCLWIEKGDCKFSHDKKNISVCRKFIKGMCLDNECLLSHDITSNKMPTCYFYLRGMCTKVNCPYLHVKLNENTKVCSEFQRGYCEKGEMCLRLHIMPSTDSTGKEHRSKCDTFKNKKLTNKIKSTCKTKKEISGTSATKCELKQTTKIAKGHTPYLDNKLKPEQRYYKDSEMVENSDVCQVIKPLRCKLGDLPSFIEL